MGAGGGSGGGGGVEAHAASAIEASIASASREIFKACPLSRFIMRRGLAPWNYKYFVAGLP